MSTQKPHCVLRDGVWVRSHRHVPSTGLLAAVRAGFVSQQTSLSSWCRTERITRPWVDQVLTGRRKGPRASAMVQRVMKAAGVAK